MEKPPPQRLKEWIARINRQEMPVLHTTISALRKLTEQEDVSISELTQIILLDASLTARILKLVNSPFYNPSGTTVSTVSRAVVLLGFNVIRDLAISVAIIDSLLKGDSRSNVKKILAQSFLAAVQARTIAEKHGEKDLEEIFIASLLANLGEITFWCFAKEAEIARLNQWLGKPGYDDEKAQRKALGVTFAELTLALVNEWHLQQDPSLLQHLLNGEKEAGDRIKILDFGRELARIQTSGGDGNEAEEVQRKLVAFLDLSIKKVRQFLRENTEQAAEMARNMGDNSISALIPADSEPEPAGEEEEETPPPYPEPDPVLQLKVLRELSSILDSKPDLNLVLEMLLEGVYRGIGVDRAVFALYQPLSLEIKAKYALGADADNLIKNFIFPVKAGAHNPFAEVLFEGRELWIKNTSDPSLSQDFTQRLQDFLQVKECFLTPIIVNRHPVGLFYCDRGPSQRPLDENSFESFRHLSQQACISIDYISRGGKKLSVR